MREGFGKEIRGCSAFWCLAGLMGFAAVLVVVGQSWKRGRGGKVKEEVNRGSLGGRGGVLQPD